MTKYRVAVVADIGLDVRRAGFSSRISPEDPACKVLVDETCTYELGLGANVARWLAARDELVVDLYGHYCPDAEGLLLRDICGDSRVFLQPTLQRTEPGFCTTRKERICLLGSEGKPMQQMVRCDRDTNCEMTRENLLRLQHALSGPAYDLLVVADYGKGIFRGAEGAHLRDWLGNKAPLLVVNSKTPKWWESTGMEALVCNLNEALSSWSRPLDPEGLRFVQTRYLAVTMGPGGAEVLIDQGRSKVWNRTLVEAAATDVTGAGDAFTAGFAFQLLMDRKMGLSPALTACGALSALHRGQVWAESCCRQVGVGSPVGMSDGLPEIHLPQDEG